VPHLPPLLLCHPCAPALPVSDCRLAPPDYCCHLHCLFLPLLYQHLLSLPYDFRCLQWLPLRHLLRQQAQAPYWLLEEGHHCGLPVPWLAAGVGSHHG
jgi:hypothetical protein